MATAYERGWSTPRNGDLLDAAERDGYSVLITTDTSLKYQQNLSARRIAIVVLSTPSWPRIQDALEPIARAIDESTAGSYTEIAIP